ncbi:MAG: hypothetical protein V4510_12850 [bacterium]
MNTRKHLHAAKRRELEERKAERIEADTQYRRASDAELRKMLKGVDVGYLD